MQRTHLQESSSTVRAALSLLGRFGVGLSHHASWLVAADRAVERANATMEAAIRMVVTRRDGDRNFADHEFNFRATLGRLGAVSLASVPSPL